MKKLNWLQTLLLPTLITVNKALISLIKNSILEDYLLYINSHFEALGHILTDDDKDNAAQVQKYFAEKWRLIVAESLEFAADMIEFYGTDQERDEAGGLLFAHHC